MATHILDLYDAGGPQVKCARELQVDCRKEGNVSRRGCKLKIAEHREVAGTITQQTAPVAQPTAGVPKQPTAAAVSSANGGTTRAAGARARRRGCTTTPS
jgi:hypothetical protein